MTDVCFVIENSAEVVYKYMRNGSDDGGRREQDDDRKLQLKR